MDFGVLTNCYDFHQTRSKYEMNNVNFFVGYSLLRFWSFKTKHKNSNYFINSRCNFKRFLLSVKTFIWPIFSCYFCQRQNPAIQIIFSVQFQNEKEHESATFYSSLLLKVSKDSKARLFTKKLRHHLAHMGTDYTRKTDLKRCYFCVIYLMQNLECMSFSILF